jgi:Tfp pilus assembly protein PilF
MVLGTHAYMVHLLDQRRFADAEAHLRQRLENDPYEASTHALRALCLADLGHAEAAVRSAEHAVELDPALAYAHWALGTVLGGQGSFAEAVAATREAIRLEPADPAHHALLAQCLAGQERWDEAIDAAEEGLRLAPDDAASGRIRALAFQQRGRAAEAERFFAEQVTRDPWDAFAHAARGWSALQGGGGAGEAVRHFRSSLALDPASEYARAGLSEALRTRIPLYGALARYSRWTRARPTAALGMVAGLALGYNVGWMALEWRPGLVWAIVPLMALYLGFVVLSSAAEPIIDFVLGLDRDGRALLDPERTVAAQGVVLTLLAGLLCLAAALVTGSEWALKAGFVTIPLVIPMSGMFASRVGWPRTVMGCYTLAAAVVGTAALNIPGRPGMTMAFAAVVVCAVGSWIASIVGAARPAR